MREAVLLPVSQWNLTRLTKTLTQAGIKVSLFIDADKAQLDAAKACGAPYVEIHTGYGFGVAWV